MLKRQLLDDGLLFLCQGQQRIRKRRLRVISQHVTEHLALQFPDLIIEDLNLFPVLLPRFEILVSLLLVEPQVISEQLPNSRLILV